MISDVEHFFHEFVGLLHVLFGKVSIPSFHPFFNWVFAVELHDVLIYFGY